MRLPPETVPQAPRRRDGEAGFTLLEVLVVIVILGLLATIAVPAVMRQLGDSRVKVAKLNIDNLGVTLDTYKLDVGSYPTTEQGLAALVERPAGVSVWNGPYLKGDKVRFLRRAVVRLILEPQGTPDTVPFTILDWGGAGT